MVYSAHVYVVNVISLKSMIYQLNYIWDIVYGIFMVGIWYNAVCKCFRSGEVLLWSRLAEVTFFLVCSNFHVLFFSG